jgi:hypothetical protein
LWLIQEMHMKETRKPVRTPRTPAVTKPAAKPASATSREAVRKTSSAVLQQTARPSPDDDHEDRVRVAAYFRAERRGFVRGYELEDWLAAEAEVRAAMGLPRSAPRPMGQRRRAKAKKV